jgi:predicted amidophosphoribosyltransferase
MQSNYCQSCFKKTTQTVDIVKFCAHCGKPFSEITSSITKPPSVSNPPWEYSKPTKQSESKEYREKIISRHKNKRLMDDVSDDDSV